MRLARYHDHTDVRIAPGVDDVHGRYPGLRRGDFVRAPGTVYVAYVSDDVTWALFDDRALYRRDFGRLTSSAHYEFKLIVREHWLYDVVPVRLDDDQRTLVMWFSRPRGDAAAADKTLPWEPTLVDGSAGVPRHARLVLFDRDRHEPAAVLTVRATSQRRGTAASGYVVADLERVYEHNVHIINDLQRIWGAPAPTPPRSQMWRGARPP